MSETGSNGNKTQEFLKVPWGIEVNTPAERVSSTQSGYKKNAGFRTVYTLDYQGLPSTRPEPKRAETSEHLPKSWPFESSHYNSTYLPKQYSRYTVQPASVHRKNNPHPTLYDPWQYPNMRYQIWKPRANNGLDPIRENKSAPNMRRNNKMPWTTTYNVTHAGKSFDNLPDIQPRAATTKEKNKWNTCIKTPPLHMMSMYKHDFPGEFGRPSTMTRFFHLLITVFTLIIINSSLISS